MTSWHFSFTICQEKGNGIISAFQYPQNFKKSI